MVTDHGHCERCEATPYWWLDSEVLITTADADDDMVTFGVEDVDVEVPAATVERFCRAFLEYRERRRAAR